MPDQNTKRPDQNTKRPDQNTNRLRPAAEHVSENLSTLLIEPESEVEADIDKTGLHAFNTELLGKIQQAEEAEEDDDEMDYGRLK